MNIQHVIGGGGQPAGLVPAAAAAQGVPMLAPQPGMPQAGAMSPLVAGQPLGAAGLRAFPPGAIPRPGLPPSSLASMRMVAPPGVAAAAQMGLLGNKTL